MSLFFFSSQYHILLSIECKDWDLYIRFFVVVALRQAERRQASELSNHRRELEDMTSHSQERIQSLESGLAKVQIERNLLNSNLSANTVFKNR